MLLAVDPTGLDPAALIEHIADCRDHLRRAVYCHHRYTIPCLLPLGDLIAHVEEWTGEPAVAVYTSLRGSSDVSLGAITELQAAATAIRSDPAARVLLDADGDPAELLDQLRRLPGAARHATIGYLDVVGHRPVNGHDIGEPCASEMPRLLLRTLREAVDGTAATRLRDTADHLSDLRAEVPLAHRSAFDAMVAEARHINRLRDERDLLADGTAEGITRRAILGAGRLLTDMGAVGDPTHLAEATFEEIRLLLNAGGPDRNTSAPTAAELADRAAYARKVAPSTAPALLGEPLPPPPDPTWLPPAMARVERAVDAGLGAIFGGPPDIHTGVGDALRGVGTSGGAYSGPARVVRTTADFDRVRPGDVLVASASSPGFNVILPLISAVVTDSGGLLSHAAIVAREAGIPGVVGCGDATARIPDGTVVRVDADTGEVLICAAPAGGTQSEGRQS
jgi:pyruvate,water dikinase